MSAAANAKSFKPEMRLVGALGQKAAKKHYFAKQSQEVPAAQQLADFALFKIDVFDAVLRRSPHGR